MNVKRWGNGDRVFLGIHGWAGNHRTFKPIAEHAPSDVSFFSVDLPGYGESPAPEQWDLAGIAGELAALVQKLGRDGVTIVGYCGGAALGILVARLQAARIKRLVMIDPFAYMPWYFRVFTWGGFGRRAYMSTFASERGRRLTNAALKNKRGTDTNLTQSFERVDHELTLRALRAFTNFPHYKTFATLTIDVDLVYGERSFKAVKQGVRRWRSIWPHARVHELHGAGHDPIRESGEQLRSIVFGEST